jgi:hypothetical protein
MQLTGGTHQGETIVFNLRSAKKLGGNSPILGRAKICVAALCGL